MKNAIIMENITKNPDHPIRARKTTDRSFGPWHSVSYSRYK
uniref:Uncharacterized protein n=1 Tax=uncultured Desulfobacterium sp. TaxID=201089 RepID=E1YFV2_9BACT|nr:unknown protein [uncultured Desulfobacterium sp.]